MYNAPPVASLVPAVGGLVATTSAGAGDVRGLVDTVRDSAGAVLPNTGAPFGPLLTGAVLAAAVAMVLAGIVLVRRAGGQHRGPRRPGRIAKLTRPFGWLVAFGFLAAVAVDGLFGVDAVHGWDVLGLVVAVLTLAYAMLAARNVLPAGRLRARATA